MTIYGVPQKSSIGVVYIVFGKRSSAAAKNSYDSLRRFCDIPAVTIGDHRAGKIPFIRWTGESPWQFTEPLGQRFYAGRIKPFLYKYSPFRKTLYLDADTEICASIMQGFDYLDEYDMCISDDPRTLESTFRKSKPGPRWDWIREQRDFTHNYLKRDTNPQINTGVIFFRESETTRFFFENWYQEWLRFPKWDEQMSFMRAEHNCNTTKVLHLNTIWNTNNESLPNKIIYHMWGQQKARDLYAD